MKFADEDVLGTSPVAEGHMKGNLSVSSLMCSWLLFVVSISSQSGPIASECVMVYYFIS